MPESRKLAGPIMSRSASLDTDEARRHLCEEFQYLLATQLSPHNYVATDINRMNLKHRFRYIDANSRDLFLSNAPGLSILTDAIPVPGEREPSISSILHRLCSDPLLSYAARSARVPCADSVVMPEWSRRVLASARSRASMQIGSCDWPAPSRRMEIASGIGIAIR